MTAAKTLVEYLKDKAPGPFKPVPWNNEAFRCWEWYWSDEPAYQDPVHHEGVWVGSVMRSMATGEAVGVQIFKEAVR